MISDPVAHLQLALERLDLLIHREIVRLRARYALSLDEFRGLYISDEQVDRLTDQILMEEESRLDVVELTKRAKAIREVVRDEAAATLAWSRVVGEFGLSTVEEDILLLATALEMDSKYETLFAYLNNNVARKWPTLDLAVRLFGDDDRQAPAVRRALLGDSTLAAEGLIEMVDKPSDAASRLGSAFRVSQTVMEFVLGLKDDDVSDDSDSGPIDASRSFEASSPSDELAEKLRRAAGFFESGDAAPPLLVFEGREGKRLVDAAASFCRRLGVSLRAATADAFMGSGDEASALIRRLRLEQRLYGHGICIEGIDAWLASEGKPRQDFSSVVGRLSGLRGPVILTCSPGADWKPLLQDCRVVRFVFPEASYEERLARWKERLEGHGISEDAVEGLAARFALSDLQIARVYDRAVDARRVAGLTGLSEDALFESARFESSRQLGKLAVKVKPKHGWDDLVLPEETMAQVREVSAAVRHRHLVYRSWGMERRVTYGRGLKVLFTGASGTGKTMTASVIAGDLSLDLYKIDLSGIVSRYVGQTEKNLDRIFRAASTSNSILFFDEADALFGKRSEVKDAHDRYANIEISYLLQKMDEFDGAVILATNLKKNIDLAFSRRMHYVVEFPTPEEGQREKLWRGMFPDPLPLDPSVDFSFLAHNFELSGGDIQNVVLDASFQAAQDGRIVTMRQIVNAVARQLRKQGRLPAASDFRQYFNLIGRRNGNTAPVGSN